MKIGNEIMHGVEIDWEKRDWKRIYTTEEEMERVGKMLRLNGGPGYNPATERFSCFFSKEETDISNKSIGFAERSFLYSEGTRESRKGFGTVRCLEI